MDPMLMGGLMGGALSLVSGLTGVIAAQVLQYVFETRKLATRIREHPRTTLYEKQAAFLDAVAPRLWSINDYLIEVSSWAHTHKEGITDAELRSALENNDCVWEFKGVVDQFRLYLPEVILAEACDLGGFCAMLISASAKNAPEVEKRADEGREKLFAFQNRLRALAGIESLSHELLTAFDQHRAKVGARRASI
jgi:hypothetical protein